MPRLEAGFERELGFDELLPARLLAQAGPALAGLLGGAVRILTADGQTRYGPPEPLPAGARAPLVYDLETVGQVEAVAAPDRLANAARLLNALMYGSARYLLAASLHHQTVDDSYRELREQHAALQVSERKYRELAATLEQRVQAQVASIEATQRQLYQAEKLASVGHLAAGVAHEINNPLAFVRSNLEQARGYVQRLGPLRPCAEQADAAGLAALWRQADLGYVLEDFPTLLEESIQGVERVARIVACLRDFSRVDAAGLASVQINDALRTVCELAASQVSPRAEVHLEAGPVPPLQADAARLNQVFLNLLLNAAEAMDRRGAIRIASSVEGAFARIDFADQGRGIAAEVLPHIFDPFFTTHEVGQGTGLGLSVARDIVGAHGGRIEVRSSPGAGSTFSVFLPLATQRP